MGALYRASAPSLAPGDLHKDGGAIRTPARNERVRDRAGSEIAGTLAGSPGHARLSGFPHRQRVNAALFSFFLGKKLARRKGVRLGRLDIVDRALHELGDGLEDRMGEDRLGSLRES